MAKYILVYQINQPEYHICETYVETFGMEESKMHDRVNELAVEHKDGLQIFEAGFLQVEFTYEPVAQVTKYKPVRVSEKKK